MTNSTTLQAALPVGDTCKTNSSANYQLTYNLICDANVTTPIFDSSSFDLMKCQNQISITSKEGKN